MEHKTLGMMISSLRKEKGMTQLDLANLMHVTDKAVSKWERDLSCPDIHSLPNLARHLGVSVDDLMQCKPDSNDVVQGKIKDMVDIIFRSIPVAMGIAVVVLSILDELKAQDALVMLAIGLACAGISLLRANINEDYERRYNRWIPYGLMCSCTLSSTAL